MVSIAVFAVGSFGSNKVIGHPNGITIEGRKVVTSGYAAVTSVFTTEHRIFSV